MKKIKVPQYKYEGKLGSVTFKNLIIYLDDEDVENINLELILKKKNETSHLKESRPPLHINIWKTLGVNP